MLLGGELDAAFVRPNRTVGADNVIERSQRIQGSGNWSGIVPAFGDGIAEGRRFFAAHRFIPINHTYVIRGELLHRHPWIASTSTRPFWRPRRSPSAIRSRQFHLGSCSAGSSSRRYGSGSGPIRSLMGGPTGSPRSD